MGTSRNGTSGGGASAATSQSTAFPQGGMRTGSQRARGRYARNAAAAGRTSQVSDEEFIRATGVNPRTGRRVRRRG